jgi:hypothetical protein
MIVSDGNSAAAMKRYILLGLLAILLIVPFVQVVAERLGISVAETPMNKRAYVQIAPFIQRDWLTCRKSSECTWLPIGCYGEITVNTRYLEEAKTTLWSKFGSGCLDGRTNATWWELVESSERAVCFSGLCRVSSLRYIWSR